MGLTAVRAVLSPCARCLSGTCLSLESYFTFVKVCVDPTETSSGIYPRIYTVPSFRQDAENEWEREVTAFPGAQPGGAVMRCPKQ